MPRSPLALVIEDAPELSALVGALLRHAGLDVVCAREGFEALAVARDRRPDLICLDLMLPTIGGFEVCERLRTMPETSGTPVLVTSARITPQDRAHAARAGANAYLTKPLDPAAFLAEVRALLNPAAGAA